MSTEDKELRLKLLKEGLSLWRAPAEEPWKSRREIAKEIKLPDITDYPEMCPCCEYTRSTAPRTCRRATAGDRSGPGCC